MAGAIVCGANSALADENFEYHGYLRAGGGWSENGTQQSCFKLNAYGSGATSRLGNECGGLYGELTLAHWANKPKEGSTEAWFKTSVTLSVVADMFASWEPTNTDDLILSLREVYTQAGNILPNEALIWIGKRFYRRVDIHMLDLFVSTNSGGRGFGIEEMKLGDGRFAFAITQYKNANSFTIDDETSVSMPLENVFDVRYAWSGFDVHLIHGQTGQTSATGDNNAEKYFEAMSGQSLFVSYYNDMGEGRSNKTIFQYGRGIYGPNLGSGDRFMSMSDGSNVVRKGESAKKDAVDESSAIRVINQHIKQDNAYEYAFVAIAQQDDITSHKLGDQSDAKARQTLLAEVRGSYYLNDNTKLTADVSHWAITNAVFGEANSEEQNDQALTKVTLATELVPSRGYWVRPSLRFFVTHASWDDGAQTGGVGGLLGHQQDEKSGLTYGFQTEYWW